MSTLAQDEYNALFASKDRRSHHPEDTTTSASEEDSSPPPSPSFTKYSAAPNGRSLRSPRRITHDSTDSENSDSSVGDEPKGPAYHLPRNSRVVRGNTGPKGVIADAWAAEQAKRGHVGNAGVPLRAQGQESWPERWKPSRGSGFASHGQGATRNEDEEANDEEDEHEEEDDEYVSKWREMRIGELRNSQPARDAARGGRMGYGTLEVVDAMGYIDAVDGASGSTVVAVYIFDDELLLSKAYQSHLATIASKYSNVRFIALHYEEAEMEHAGVPALLAYRGGEKFADLVPLRDEVPFTCNVVTNLEEALKSHGIL